MVYINIRSIKVRTAFMLLVWSRNLVAPVFWRTSSPSAKVWFKLFVKWTLLFIKKLSNSSCFSYRLSWGRLRGAHFPAVRLGHLTRWHWPHHCKALMRTKTRYSAPPPTLFCPWGVPTPTDRAADCPVALPGREWGRDLIPLCTPLACNLLETSLYIHYGSTIIWDPHNFPRLWEVIAFG